MLRGMTKTILATLASLAALVYSPAYAHTDLEEDWTDNPVSSRYEQHHKSPAPAPQQQYAMRTECELPPSVHSSAPASTQQASVTPKQPSVLERICETLKKDCDNVRLENNYVICKDKVKCIKNDMTDEEYQKKIDEDPCGSNEYCPGPSFPSCVEWQMRERWRFNPSTIGKVEALLIDTQKIEGLEQPLSLGYALIPVGKKELYTLQTESTAREVRGLINYGKYGK